MEGHEKLCRAAGREVGLIVPKLATGADGLRPDTAWEATPMTYGQFVSLLRALLVFLGWTPDQARRFTTYSLRRFIPTAAAKLGMTALERQAVGDWDELPQGEDAAPLRAQHLMAGR